MSAALAQFIKPISTSANLTTTRDRANRNPQKENSQEGGKENFQRFQPEAPPPDNVVPFPKENADPNTPPLKQASSGDSRAFLQLFTLLRSQKMTLLRWFGARAYQKPNLAQRKAGNYRKGAMLDKKAE